MFIAWTNTVFGKFTVGAVRKIGSGKFHHPLRLLLHDRISAVLLAAALLKPGTAVSTSGTAYPTTGLHPAARHTAAGASRGNKLCPAAGRRAKFSSLN